MKRALAFGLVSAQFVLLAALAILPHGYLWPVSAAVLAAVIALGALGALLAVLGVAGLGPALTASPIPREHAPLVTTGIYGLVRSPIYTGLMTGGLGLALFGRSVWHIAAWLALVLLLAGKARWEERMLLAEHPDYAGYGARVGRFLPRVGRLRRSA
ncbi:isoprenylcysteine carboxylmethyltransferase family protein [Cryobacterium algoritolerans]|uniref:Isoprenylcysteine carboxylmethyltransferase family protein n=1 Tax=Cryobacterium algoritolerans TaxID=1259184 RepID=A0A4R8WI19_9MICO|nr:methyltransferase [Cryobacterium algoritolerans]TFC10361.1 isoprenylcysteine carboxylmethyltransferase family protein [Cryobacterium algoritolerans]